jgi:hypothetical protein
MIHELAACITVVIQVKMITVSSACEKTKPVVVPLFKPYDSDSVVVLRPRRHHHLVPEPDNAFRLKVFDAETLIFWGVSASKQNTSRRCNNRSKQTKWPHCQEFCPFSTLLSLYFAS